ncbi:hypothetical protein [Pseudomonas sp.]|uniref:hypothetical protein n=1 Tax=Pseudomonas sp. TaxID=306 RepID=UPI0027302D55|nr:hypothetical protein [Pseudomonas sp.]MDP2244002.1 hypothetical protein [Pseudomonas sp.]
MWINPETLELSAEPAANLERVMETQCPLTERLEKAVPDGAELIDGMWQQTWRIEPLDAAEVAQVVEAERVNSGLSFGQLCTKNNAAYETAIAALTSAYPPSEIATWERQRAESLAWSINADAPTPWIDIASTARGIPRDEYLARTLIKATQFAQASAYLTGLRQRYEHDIKSATTAEQLAAITFDYTLPVAP